MNAEILFNEIRDYCSKNANPDNVVKYSRYFKEGYDAYGLDNGLVTNKCNEIFGSEGFNLDLCIKLSELLVPCVKYEEVSFAIVLLGKFHKQFTKETFNSVSHWFDIGIVNWAHADYISGELLNIFLKNQIITPYDFTDWISSDKRFKRRAAAVGLIKYIKAKNPIEPILEFLEPLMLDTERVVHQGMGWFLREAWKLNPEPVEEFLLKYKNTSARLIFQYACEKMSSDYKKKFAKDKKK